MFACVAASTRPDLASLLETSSGKIVTELIKDDANRAGAIHLDEPYVVLFQRGLTCAPDRPPRSSRGLLSPYKLSCGDKEANVPWKNFAYSTPSKMGCRHPKRPPCGGCLQKDCNDCIAAVARGSVKVTWKHNQMGGVYYLWYVVWEDSVNNESAMLSPVCTQFAAALLLAIRDDYCCPCGKCSHPLSEMRMPGNKARPRLEKEAVVQFLELQSGIKKVAEVEKKCAPRKRNHAQLQMSGAHEGVCAVCLEETTVSAELCVQKRCGVEICADCHQKTRGLCPLCDRSKLSKSCDWMCFSCNKAARLEDYGFECISCGKPRVCRGCFKMYSQCLHCELGFTCTRLDQER
tara:strand:+ start:1637 stop:2680 length:1044 start_codon:yes stop_codon:yes gene_type:complete